MTSPELAVNIDQLSRVFGEFKAVDEISLSVKKGEIFGFLGANGAGKTTTIRMLCGLLLPSSGQASVLGFDVYTQSEKIKENIGYMSQKFSLYGDLTISENIEFYGGIFGLSAQEIKEKTKEILSSHNLYSQANQLTAKLPLGWKQRLALSVALLHNPSLLFLDEPTSGVDPIARREFWIQIYELARQGKTVFVTTHYMDEAEYCGRICIMKDGKIVALDTPENLKKQLDVSNIQDVFFKAVSRREA
jgi:ABC-2 type transport system ATP-binding protein